MFCRRSVTRSDGAVIGARGAYGLMSPKTHLNEWFFNGYEKANGTYPVQAAYRVAQSILGVKNAVENAMAKNDGKKPTTDELVAAMTGSEWQSPGGLIQMKNRRRPSGHPADRVQPHQIQIRKRSGSNWSTSSTLKPNASTRLRREGPRLDQGRNEERQVQVDPAD